MTEAFPLAWPQGWPRTPSHKRTYNHQLKLSTFDSARDKLLDELRKLSARSVVLSTSIPLRRDGNGTCV
jgi:hypothetical protein